MSELFQTGGNFRCIQDRHDLVTYLGQEWEHGPAVIQRYIERRLETHVHMGIASSSDRGDTAYFCARLHFWDVSRRLEAKRSATNELPMVLYPGKCGEDQAYGLVFVLVREISERQNRLIGGIPSLVQVQAMDEVDYVARNPGEGLRYCGFERHLRRADRELNQPETFGIRRSGGIGTVENELPSNVVKYAPVVVDGVSESRSERAGQVRVAPLHDQLKDELISDPYRAGLSVWFTTDGWLGMGLEEPEHFTLRCCHMEVRPLEFDSGAAEGIAHKATSP